jgi:hypothetical protein
MSFAFPTPDHMPCPDCGASIPVAGGSTAHVCDEDRRLDYKLVELRPGIERVGDDLAEWLETPQGRFARWLAEHDRRRPAA